MSNYQTTPVGKIPVEWTVELIGSFFDIQQGKQLSAANRKGKNVKKFLRTANIFWGKIDFTNLDEMNFSDADEERMELKLNDLLVCEGGDIGRTAMCQFDLSGIYYQNHLHRLRPKNESVIPEFFMYWMWYTWTLTDYYIGAGNKTTIPNLSKAKLSGLYFAKPSQKEQYNITYILSTLQKAIQKQEEIISTATALKKSLLNKLFTEGTKGESLKKTEIGMMPESWGIVRLEEVYGFTYKPKEISISATAEVPFIPMDLLPSQDFFATNYIVKNGGNLTSGTYIEDGDLLLAKITPSFENGKQGVAKLNSYKWGYATTEVIPIKAKRNISSITYLFYYLLKLDVRKSLEDKMEGSTGRQRLSKSSVKDLLLPFPSEVKEQEEIGTIFRKIDEKITVHKKKLSIYNNLFKTLLEDLMTGSIRVHKMDFHSKISSATVEDGLSKA